MRVHIREQNIYEKIILKLILLKSVYVDWTHIVQDYYPLATS